MDFNNSYRMESVYFKKLKSDIDIIKSLMKPGNDEEARSLLENSVDVDGAVLLLYRNLGDAWSQLNNLFTDLSKRLDLTKEDIDKYNDELNKKIDDVNNYIIRIIQYLDETKEDKVTEPAKYQTTPKLFNLFTDVTAQDEVSNSVNNYYEFYIRNTYMRDPEHKFDTPDAITLRELSIGPVDLENYLAPLKAFMRNNNIAGVDILSRTSLIIEGADYLKYDVTNTVQIYNRPNVTDATQGGIILHSEPNRETFIDCTKFHGTKYYLQKRVSFNLIPQENTVASVNMSTLATDYIIDIIPKLNQIVWYEHKKI